jgi:hypothetical protein
MHTYMEDYARQNGVGLSKPHAVLDGTFKFVDIKI